VVLFAFNRPSTTARVFETVRAARPPRLFLVCDGPRADRPGEAERCAEVRALLERVDWPCEVERDYADTNLGCRRRISSGIAWVFSRVEEAVFLEDDTLADASFFPYCDELLARYRDDERVLMVCGNSMLRHGPSGSAAAGARRRAADGAGDDASYWFSAHPRIWGWASWRRAWTEYDAEMRAWPAMRDTPAWTARTPAEQRAWGGFFDAVKAGRVDTWDAQVTVMAWRRGMLCAIPSVNLVENIGYGALATNTHAAEYPGPPAGALTFPLRHPPAVARDDANDAEWVRLENPPAPSLLSRVLRRLKRMVST
jgi:hypothetical protein